MKSTESILGFLGILYRAKKLEIGSSLWHQMPKVRLFLKASDADSGEAIRYEKKIKNAHLPYLELPFSKEELGGALGKSEVTFVGITDKKSALALISKING